jgi:predicted ATPase
VTAHLLLHRLVSLVGIGGSGKTRLAQATAATAIEQYPDGVWFIDLVPVSAESELPAAIATAAGFNLGARDPFDAIVRMMAGRRALFVVDNCEHLTDGVANLVDAILAGTKEPRFLITSREPLDLTDEKRYAVSPLDASDAASPAVELFVNTAARAGSTIDDAVLPVVAEICQRLDGLPLAIELAAGQLCHLAPKEILGRLDQRFALLAGGRGRRGRRQASLEGVLQETWNMLDQNERDLLQHLAAFPASFDLETAEDLFGSSTIGVLAGLVDRSLVVAEVHRGAYRLLETVKLFARRQWQERANPDEYLDRHARTLIARIEAWSDDEIYSLHSVLGWHVRHVHDLRAADDYLHARGAVAAATKLWAGGAILWHLGPPATSATVLDRIDRCLRSGKLDRAAEARAEIAAACAAMATRQQDRITSSARRAVEAATDAGCDVVRAFALNALSWMTMITDQQAAIDLLLESERVAIDAGAPNVAIAAMAYRACAMALHQSDEALALIEEADRANAGASTYAASSLADIRLIASLFDQPDKTAAGIAERVVALERIGLAPSFQALNEVALTKAANADPTGTLDALVDTENEVRRAGVDDGLPDLLLAPAVLAYVLGTTELASRWITAIRLAAKPTQNLPSTAIYRQLRQRVGLAHLRDGLDDTQEAYREARKWLVSVADTS